MAESDDPMKSDSIQYGTGTTALRSIGLPASIGSAGPYLKVIGLVTTLLIAWVSLCAT